MADNASDLHFSLKTFVRKGLYSPLSLCLAFHEDQRETYVVNNTSGSSIPLKAAFIKGYGRPHYYV